MLGHEFGVLTWPIARTLDLDDDRMMQEPVEERRGDDWIPRGFIVPPFSTASYVRSVLSGLQSDCRKGRSARAVP